MERIHENYLYIQYMWNNFLYYSHSPGSYKTNMRIQLFNNIPGWNRLKNTNIGESQQNSNFILFASRKIYYSYKSDLLVLKSNIPIWRETKVLQNANCTMLYKNIMVTVCLESRRCHYLPILPLCHGFNKHFSRRRKCRLIFLFSFPADNDSFTHPLCFISFPAYLGGIYKNKLSPRFFNWFGIFFSISSSADSKMLLDDLNSLSLSGKLYLNLENCFCITFSRNKNMSYHQYYMKNTLLYWKIVVKDLGTVYDSKCSFNSISTIFVKKSIER